MKNVYKTIINENEILMDLTKKLLDLDRKFDNSPNQILLNEIRALIEKLAGSYNRLINALNKKYNYRGNYE